MSKLTENINGPGVFLIAIYVAMAVAFAAVGHMFMALLSTIASLIFLIIIIAFAISDSKNEGVADQ